MNLYAYVDGNPVNAVDVEGLTYWSNYRFLIDFELGTGQPFRIYGNSSIETQEMQKSDGVAILRDRFYSQGCRNVESYDYDTGDAAWNTIINPLTRDLSSTATQVGGYGRATAMKNGNGTVTFTIRNIAGASSFFYHLINDKKSSTGPFRSITQMFSWTEQIDECKCNKKQ